MNKLQSIKKKKKPLTIKAFPSHISSFLNAIHFVMLVEIICWRNRTSDNRDTQGNQTIQDSYSHFRISFPPFWLELRTQGQISHQDPF